MVAGMDEDAVRIVPIEDGVRIVPVEGVHDSSGRARPPWWVVVVMVVSTIGLVWMFNQGSDPEPEPEPVEFRTVYSVPEWGDPNAAPVARVIPRPQSLLGFEWSVVAIFGAPESNDIQTVIRGGPGFVAVGRSDNREAVWISEDGTTWSQVLGDESPTSARQDRWMSAVAVGGPGLVAVGGAESTGGDPSRSWEAVDGVVWTSVDGLAWTRVAHDNDVFGSATLTNVIAGGPGLVALGSDLERNGAAVWVSVDGLTWSRADVDESVFREATIESVVAGGPGLVAVGYVDGDEHASAAVWVSPDGTSWTRVPHSESVFGGEGRAESVAGGDRLVAMYDITAGGPGLVAVGSSGQGAVVWTSEDGTTWMRVPHDESTFGGPQYPSLLGPEMLSVAAAGQRLIAVGFGHDPLWTSTDGLTWTRSTDGRIRGHTLIANGSGYFLINGNELWIAVPSQ
jgi:hypothetical protein